MRCDNCDYCKSGDYYGTYWECSLCIEGTENKKGQCGCPYNRKTLDKIHQKQIEEENDYIRSLSKCGLKK